MAFLAHPLIQLLPKGGSLIFTGVPEAFFTYFKAAIYVAVFFSSPFILYQLWAFISPGLYEREKKYIYPYLFVSSVFFIAGALFCYYIFFPVVFRFFLSFASQDVRPFPAIKDYVAFAVKFLLAFGLLFQWPAMILFLARVGIVSSQLLAKNRKYAVLAVFLVAAILTPPDVVSQLLLAGPLLILYEGSIWMAKFFGKKEKAKEKNEKADSSSTPENASI